jgi:calcium-dependent protein kinase
LGEGTYGVVYECREKDTGEMRAIKQLERLKIKNPKRFNNELIALRTLDHPNIIKLFEIFEDKDNIYLVQELCSGGELFDQLAERDHFDELYAANVFEQILKALWYSHKNKICHRDLKPENFMFSVDGETIKLIDFGLSRSFFQVSNTGEKAFLRMQTKAGTAFFMAPEVIQGNYSNSCDMWSAGCILYLMLSGYPPFDGETQEEIFESILEGEVDFSEEEWQNVSEEAKDLIINLLTNENDRLTPKAALKHPWFKSSLKKSKKKKLSFSHMERLKSFSKANKIRKIICTFLASRVSNEEVQKQLESFDKLDKNKDGYITLKELQKGLGDSFSMEDAQRIMDSVDTDKNGAIDYNEFLAATLDGEIAKNLKKLEMAFKYFDSNKDGYIDDKELNKALEK